MLIGGIALGLVLGLVLGGRIERLADIRLRLLPVLFAGVILRFGTELLLGMGVGIVEALRVPLLLGAYALLLFTLWRNRAYPGLALAFIGIALNAVVITVNGGRMPVWMDAYAVSGLSGPLSPVLHVPMEATDPAFYLRLGFLGDVIPLPVPPLQNVASIGDLFLTSGLAFFLFATLIRGAPATDGTIEEVPEERLLAVAGTARLRAPGQGLGTLRDEDGNVVLRGSTGLSPALEDTAALERPRMLGGTSTGMASPALFPIPDAADLAADRAAERAAAEAAHDAAVRARALAGMAAEAPATGRERLAEQVREHPYMRLALNGSFSALWVGQLISLFGDRVNQIALLAFVYRVTGESVLAIALTFIASSLPNLVFSPVAGALVDRWDHKQVLIVSDILRAAIVLLVPVAILVNVWIAYPLIFLITTVSIFFRPARISILPRIVEERDLLSANSAMWVGETIADVVNYPLAGLFVLFLADSLAVAFWFDAASYLASAGLLATIVVPPLVRAARGGEGDGAAGDVDLRDPDDVRDPRDPVDGAHGGPPTPREIAVDLKAGWAFLRTEATLLANTIQGTAGQFAVGILTALSFPIARAITPGAEEATYAFMETSIGVGNLVGGFLLGLLAARVRKGRMIIAGYAAFGLLVALIGLLPPLPLMLGLMFGIGIANMAFLIPSQTLFQERTPPELMARVVSFRFAIVFGGMTVATALGGLAAQSVGLGPVIALAGIVSLAAGLSGLMVRAVRDA